MQVVCVPLHLYHTAENHHMSKEQVLCVYQRFIHLEFLKNPSNTWHLIYD